MRDERIKRVSRRLEAVDPIRDRWILLCLLLLIAVTIYLLNIHTPLQLDDYDYSINWATGEPIRHLSEVFASQRAHYQLWGGRSIVHALAQGFIVLGKPIFNLFNTLAYLVLLMEIVWLSSWGREKAPLWIRLLIAHTVLFFGVAFFGTVFLWLDGACNYLWGTLIALWPMMILKWTEEHPNAKGSYSWAFVPLCFISGWTNENTALGILLARAIWLLTARRRRKISAWEWISLAAEALGVALMLLAPGNFARAGQGTVTLTVRLRGFASGCYALAVTASPYLASVPMLLAMGNSEIHKEEKRWMMLLLGSGLLCGLTLIVSPQVSDRAFTGMIALLLAGVIFLGVRTLDTPQRTSACLLALPFVLIILISGGRDALREVRAQEEVWHRQLAQIDEAKAEGKAAVEVEDIISTSRFTQDIHFAAHSDEWPNSTLGKIKGIQIIGNGHH